MTKKFWLIVNKDVLKNPAMLDALIGVYERNVLGYECTAVLPYSQGLSRFPAHLQQLDMESNGNPSTDLMNRLITLQVQ